MRAVDRWGATVNGVAAWPLWDMRARAALLRRFGLDVGADTVVQARCFFGSDRISIGRDVHIGPGCLLDGSDAITLEDGCGLGYETAIITGNHEFGPATKRYGEHRNAPVLIGAGAWIGARVTILPGVTVGRGAVVGAGSLVTKDCEPDTVYIGSPARPVKVLPAD